jgi:DNA-binding transcriptional ArsR family regulator
MEEKEIVRSLGALAHEARLKVFRALVVAGDRGMTPSVMAEGAGMAATTLSFHLKELMHAGLVTQERDGRHLDLLNALPSRRPPPENASPP